MIDNRARESQRVQWLKHGDKNNKVNQTHSNDVIHTYIYIYREREREREGKRERERVLVSEKTEPIFIIAKNFMELQWLRYA